MKIDTQPTRFETQTLTELTSMADFQALETIWNSFGINFEKIKNFNLLK